MGINAKITPTSSYKISVNQSDGRIQTNSPISLRNTIRESAQTITNIENIEDIQNVSVVNRVDGATVVYDSENSRYEIKLPFLDGGLF